MSDSIWQPLIVGVKAGDQEEKERSDESEPYEEGLFQSLTVMLEGSREVVGGFSSGAVVLHELASTGRGELDVGTTW